MSTNTTTYVVIRYGSNAANQSLCNRAVVGTVEAASRQEAIEIAPSVLGITVYNNQYLDAVAYNRSRRADQDAALAADAEQDNLAAYCTAIEREAMGR